MRHATFGEQGGQLLLEATVVLFLFGLALAAFLGGLLLLQRLDLTATMDQSATTVAESGLDFALTLSPAQLADWAALGQPAPLPLPAMPDAPALLPAGATFTATLSVSHATVGAYVPGARPDPSFYQVSVDVHWQAAGASGDDRLSTLVEATATPLASGANPTCREPPSPTTPCVPAVTPP
jgi:hypothetical protein